ncbi:hypothetical protein [Polyangium spumosum]|uniref:DUF1622 domain-containing protein n=1 Tax=Polyangium spumosum TaxID=889282 RepID=A0A6N7PTM1_9BACT|nr:hypothetical protein [Polyangium spumosum]MRG93780.1 hypothetical protein [Polyangium spumosum]
MDLDVVIRGTGTLIDAFGVAVIALGIVVATGRLVRHLVWTLEVELSGRFPWQQRGRSA